MSGADLRGRVGVRVEPHGTIHDAKVYADALRTKRQFLLNTLKKQPGDPALLASVEQVEAELKRIGQKLEAV